MYGKRAQAIKHPKAHQLYFYTLGPRFDAGAQAEVFRPKFQNPIASFLGAGRVGGFVAGQFHVDQPPQVNFVRQIGLVGLGGVQAGTLRGQRLLDLSSQDQSF